MSWMLLSLKVFIISTAVLFTALGLNVSVPLAKAFFATHIPLIWSFCLLCFKPPYLYLIVNAIIITIVASSRFHHSSAANPTPSPIAPPVPSYPPEFTISEPPLVYQPSGEDPHPPVLEVKAVLVNGSATDVEEEEEEEDEEEEKAMMDSTEIALEYISPTEKQKPLVSARFGHRKPLKSSPEGGRALRVAKPKRQETLENTWKAITEGRAMPLSRHMKKCDTWQNRGSAGPPEEVKKSVTFMERTNQPIPSVKLRKEPSLSQDELNRRVEAFIRKFNEDMRLQRQESLNQYMQRVNRGSN